jgi:hypothetical protein
LERNKDISIRQAEGLSVARAQGMNRKEVEDFFNILEKQMIENNLVDKGENIFNMDETGIQLINKPGRVLAAKGSKDVHVLTPKEKGETVSLIACCNAAGYFLPPVVIMKGVNRKSEFSDGLPPGSEVYMNKKSAYITTELFIKWFKEHFLPRKAPTGKSILILDGHSSHSNSIELLDLARDNAVIIICLPSHTTQALQPLDRSFFRSLKIYFNAEANSWMLRNKSRTLTRYQVGDLIGRAWGKAATNGNALSGFTACGIYPLNPNAIPDHFFTISENTDIEPIASTPSTQLIAPAPSTQSTPTQSEPLLSDLPTTSATSQKETPTKVLEAISPIPKLPISKVKRKQVAKVLTSDENIAFKKTNKPELIKSSKTKKAEKNKKKPTSSGPIADESNRCSECWENYFLTTNKCDWIQCQECHKWLHESCTVYTTMCNECGREKIRIRNTNIAK